MFKGLDFYYVTSIWIVNFLRKWNYCILSINYRRSAELSKNAKIWLSKSIFYVIKDLNISLKDIEQYHFISIFFFIDIFNFRTLAFIKRCPIFYNSTSCPIVNQLIKDLNTICIWDKVSILESAVNNSETTYCISLKSQTFFWNLTKLILCIAMRIGYFLPWFRNYSLAIMTLALVKSLCHWHCLTPWQWCSMSFDLFLM